MHHVDHITTVRVLSTTLSLSRARPPLRGILRTLRGLRKRHPDAVSAEVGQTEYAQGNKLGQVPMAFYRSSIPTCRLLCLSIPPTLVVRSLSPPFLLMEW